MTSDEFKQHLQTLGLSQRDFAAETGMSVSAVNEWATGRAKLPPIAAAYVRLRLSAPRHQPAPPPAPYVPSNIKAWAGSRETSDAIALAIFEAADEGDEGRMWESPTEDETAAVMRRAWAIDPESDTLHWGVETFKRD